MSEEMQTSFIMTCAGVVHKAIQEQSEMIIKSGLDSAALLAMLVLVGDSIISDLEGIYQVPYERIQKEYTDLLREYRKKQITKT